MRVEKTYAANQNVSPGWVVSSTFQETEKQEINKQMTAIFQDGKYKSLCRECLMLPAKNTLMLKYINVIFLNMRNERLWIRTRLISKLLKQKQNNLNP